MRTSTAYFAGAGTVIAAIVGGLGGGLLIADMVSPKSPKPELTRLEQRMSSQPIEAKAATPELAPNPAAPSPPTTAAVPAAPAQTEPPQVQATTAPAAPPPADAVAAKQPAAPAVRSEVPPSAQKQAAAAPEDALAKARDVDIKRAATDKRRSERRQQWSEKRRYQRREDPDRELREVEARVREETETRPIFTSEPVPSEMPRIRLFDRD